MQILDYMQVNVLLVVLGCCMLWNILWAWSEWCSLITNNLGGNFQACVIQSRTQCVLY